MPTQFLKFNFFKVFSPKGTPALKGVLDQVSSTAVADRNMVIKTRNYRMQELVKLGQNYVGELVQIANEIIPDKGNIVDRVDPLDLKKEEGLIRPSAFLFHPPSQVLVYESDRRGPSHSTFLQFLNEWLRRNGVNGGYDLDVLLRRDAYLRYKKMSAYRKLVIRVRPDQGQVAPELLANKAVGPLLKELQDSDARQMEVTLSLGKSRGTLVPDRIRRIVNALLDREGTKKIEVSGTDAQNHPDIVNFVEERLRSEVPVELGESRRVPFGLSSQAIASAFEEHREDIGHALTPEVQR